MLMFWGMVSFSFLWIMWNTFGPGKLHFDSGPNFALLLLISNFQQWLYLPVIQSAQKVLNEKQQEQEKRDEELTNSIYVLLEGNTVLIEGIKELMTIISDKVMEIDHDADERWDAIRKLALDNKKLAIKVQEMSEKNTCNKNDSKNDS